LIADTVLCNAKVYTKRGIVQAGIAIEGDKIAKISKETNLPPACNRVNLDGCLALPGMIDSHVHLRGQLLSSREDFSTGTSAAVAGGITTVLDMPNNKPVTKDSTSLKERILHAERSIVANVGFLSAFPERLQEIEHIVRAGAVAFKVYLTDDVGGLDIDDDELMSRALLKTSAYGVPVAVHAEDGQAIHALTKREQRLGHKNLDAYLRVHSPKVETKAVKRILSIANQSNSQIHICHITSLDAVSLVKRARTDGLSVSCEITPHHLFLTLADLKKHGTRALTDPPLRSNRIVEHLWDAVRKHDIDIIASDHAPHTRAGKEAESIWDVSPGIPGLETLLPLFLTKVNEGHLALKNLIRMTSERPAEVFHLQNEGHLEVGYKANITVVDLHKTGQIEASRFHSKAKYSPFDHIQVKGLPAKTFVNGQLVMDNGEVVARRGIGRVLRSKARK
jgi:dihydroorotase (multifunctional complex type)